LTLYWALDHVAFEFFCTGSNFHLKRIFIANCNYISIPSSWEFYFQSLEPQWNESSFWCTDSSLHKLRPQGLWDLSLSSPKFYTGCISNFHLKRIFIANCNYISIPSSWEFYFQSLEPHRPLDLLHL
jgi:hypothetical protein